MSRIGAELALGMSLALESSEADIERALAILDEGSDEGLALQLLARHMAHAGGRRRTVADRCGS